VEARVRELIEPTAHAVGCEILDVEVLGSEGHPTLRITLDRDVGVTIDDCAEVSRRLNPLLDVEDVIPGSYHLEVSSPGLNRPLKRLEHFEKYRDKRAKIETRRAPFPERNQRRFVGVLRGTRDDQVHLEEEGGTTVAIPFAIIERANLVYEFGNDQSSSRGENDRTDAQRRRGRPSRPGGPRGRSGPSGR
jgi:ribosome maturation factor RimP